MLYDLVQLFYGTICWILAQDILVEAYDLVLLAVLDRRRCSVLNSHADFNHDGLTNIFCDFAKLSFLVFERIFLLLSFHLFN